MAFLRLWSSTENALAFSSRIFLVVLTDRATAFFVGLLLQGLFNYAEINHGMSELMLQGER